MSVVPAASSALILFAHGSRDPEWVRPFERLRENVRKQTPGIAVELAYLESSAPDLDLCVRMLANDGITMIKVLPLFLALGKHLRIDIPLIAEGIGGRYPDLRIEFLPALGEAPEFVAALGAIALRFTR